MKRLTYRYENGIAHLIETELKDACEYCYDAAQKLAYYEDLEEQGRLITLPCKVGDTVWEVDTERYYYDEFMVTDITITHHGIGFENPYMGFGFNLEDFGKTIFLTKEEAEAKLKEMVGDKIDE